MKALEVTNLTKRYRSTIALDGVSLALEEGFVTGLVGLNGAGKTTLIKCVLNLVRANAGGIRVFGEDHWKERAVRSRIGFVHEASYLPEQLHAADIERIARAAYASWDHAAFQHYLERFELPRRKKMKTWSKGMRMRLSLAVALSHHAELILMDEPSSGLDPIVRRDLLGVIGEELAREHRSFLISTHITSDLDRIADYVVVLDRGRVRLSVSRDQLGDEYALCRGGRELVRRFGDRLVVERPTVEDLMVHTLKEDEK